MMKNIVLILCGAFCFGAGSQMASHAIAQVSNSTAHAYTAFAFKVTDETGRTNNSKFFVGRLPLLGESVEYVYVGNFEDDPDTMRFQLKVRQ